MEASTLFFVFAAVKYIVLPVLAYLLPMPPKE